MIGYRDVGGTVARWLSGRQKRAVKASVNSVRSQLIRRFLRYDAEQLKARLRAMGVAPSDTLLVHLNSPPDSGFAGTPADMVAALVDLVAEQGNLLMVSLPFRGSAYDHLAAGRTFNVRKTISMMGLATEIFRRRAGTVRSLHPTHPVLAAGRDAAWLVAGHEECLFPCGPGSPFDKLRTLRGKILFLDVGFEAVTFFHYVEDLLKDRLPFPIYDERLFEAPVVDGAGATRVVRTYAFNKHVPRRADMVYAELARHAKVRKGRVGHSRLLLVSAEDVVASQSALVESGRYPYDLGPAGENGR